MLIKSLKAVHSTLRKVKYNREKILCFAQLNRKLKQNEREQPGGSPDRLEILASAIGTVQMTWNGVQKNFWARRSGLFPHAYKEAGIRHLPRGVP